MARMMRAEELWRRACDDGEPDNAESLHVHIYRGRNQLAPFGVRVEATVNAGYRLLLGHDDAADRRRRSAGGAPPGNC